MSEKNLTITAVIPAYNAEKYIARSIDSVLGQTRPVDEIVVVDDGSTDATPQIIKGYGDTVRYIHQPNAGVSAARNTGIHAATGNWIAFLDADDEWLPDRLMRQVQLLEKNPHLVWVSGNFITCSCSEGRKAPYVPPNCIEQFTHCSGIMEDYFIGASHDFGGHTNVMLIRKDVLLVAGLFDTAFSKAEDLDMWWKIAHENRTVGYVSEPIAIHHFGNIQSLNKNPMDGSFTSSLIMRHQLLASKAGTEKSFERLSKILLRRWMRAMLFREQKADIRHLLREFHSLIPIWYRYLMVGLTVFPRLTKAACLLISRIVRKLKLRRRVVVLPDSSKK